MKSQAPGDYDEDGNMVWTPNIEGNSGSAGYVSAERAEADRVTRFREVVCEVTRGRIPVPVKRGPGF